MHHHKLLLVAAVAAGAVLLGLRDRTPAQEKAKAPEPAPAAAQADSAEAAIRKLAADYAAAFNAGDAKAVAAFWTERGESTDADGETIQGRDAIEKSLAEQFKTQPRVTAEVAIESVRTLGRTAAVADGSIQARTAADAEPVVTYFTSLLVRDDGGWKLASVSEWATDPALTLTLKNLDWLAGEWAAKGDGGELRISYAWEADRAFLRGTYTLTKDGKTVSSGTQVIGQNPLGGLRAWVFDSSGSFGESVWTKDGGQVIAEATATLPDGTDMTATNILVPLGPDAFTWQSTERTAGDVALPDQPPVKLTRVGKAK
ncbi:MAG TPA: nuclear transport factor 2 family protein [Fimbriiglobus sp.]|jgi:uncharacterized protein (TIGR02246 family)|nr:nuclear transport factor 2 family protein [Fimbriiglobus sp.]